MNTPLYILESLRITSDEVESTLLSLPIGKASGPDSINNKILEDLAQHLLSPLTDLFNFSLEKGKVPIIWKQANVTPIFKKDDPSELSNYMPISLLSTVGKVLEKIVHIHVFNFFSRKSHYNCLTVWLRTWRFYGKPTNRSLQYFLPSARRRERSKSYIL